MKVKESLRKFVLICVIGLTLIAVFLLRSHVAQVPKTVPKPASPLVNNTEVKSNNETTPKKVIYLTIDADMSQSMAKRLHDGEVPAWYDPQLVEYLKTNSVPATFFVSGLFAENYPELIKSLNATGNYTFENHSYDESGFTPKCYNLNILTTDQKKINQINKTQDILKNLTGRTPIYFRFPGICQSQHDDELVKSLGLTNNDGDVVASDPFNTNTAAIIANILRQAKPNGVIIMHIGGPNAPKSFEVLEQIIPKLTSQGYTIQHL